MHDRPPVPTSGKREILNIENTLTATHVYVKVDNPASLSPKFEGPYEIYSRPSRSQIEVKIGMFKDNRPRLLTFHWSNCKIANMREGAPAASRPKLGRPKNTSIPDQAWRPTDAPVPATPAPNETNSVSARSTGRSSSERDLGNFVGERSQNVNNDPGTAQIQTSAGNQRLVRSTRNPSPKYV